MTTITTMITTMIMAILKMLIPMLYIGIITILLTCIWYYPKYKKTKIGLLPYLIKIIE